MQKYPWSCSACGTGNLPEATICVQCGCPASPKFSEIERAQIASGILKLPPSSAAAARVRTPLKCPVCASSDVFYGNYGTVGDDGNVTRFFPKGLRFFALRDSVPLANGNLLRACAQCGHTWTQLVPSELRELLTHSGTPKTVERVQLIEDRSLSREDKDQSDATGPV